MIETVNINSLLFDGLLQPLQDLFPTFHRAVISFLRAYSLSHVIGDIDYGFPIAQFQRIGHCRR